MKKLISIFVIIALDTLKVFATEQRSDILEYENNEWLVNIDGKTIYDIVRNFSDSSFDSDRIYSTDLYRGYVAYYKIKNDSVFMNKVISYKNSEKGNEITDVNGLWAQKYSGIISAVKFGNNSLDSTILIKIKNGIVDKTLKTRYYSVVDLLYNNSINDKTLIEMIDEYRRYVFITGNNISQDKANFNKIKGKIVTESNKHLLDNYYKRTGKIWAYDWERSDTSGIPVAKVKFSDEKMFIDSVYVKTKNNNLISINLNLLCNEERSSNGCLADWYTGYIGINYYSTELLEMCGGYVLFYIENGNIIKKFIIDGKNVNNGKNEIMIWAESLKNKQTKRCIKHYLESETKN